MSSELHRISAGLTALVRDLLSGTDYHALYPCEVVSQNEDDSLELKSESSRLPSLSNVKIRIGIPGARARLAPGARVLVGFENGDPKRPYAGLWESATLLELVINGGSNGLALAEHTHSIPMGTDSAGGTTGACASNTSLLKVP